MDTNNNSNKILLGIIMILVALYFISRSYFSFTQGDIPILIAGFALLLLFHTKRKRWALILGVLLTYWGVQKIIPPGSYLTGMLTSAGVFLIPSFIMLALFFSTRARGYLVPGLITFWLGMYTALIPFWPLSSSSGWFLCAALILLSLYIFDRYHSGRWALNAATILLVLFIISLVGFSPIQLFFSFVPTVLCCLLIVFGVILIYRGFKR